MRPSLIPLLAVAASATNITDNLLAGSNVTSAANPVTNTLLADDSNTSTSTANPVTNTLLADDSNTSTSATNITDLLAVGSNSTLAANATNAALLAGSNFTTMAAASELSLIPILLLNLPATLKQSSSKNWATLKSISQQIWMQPELGLDEKHAHDLITNHFASVPGWKVTKNAGGLPTAFKLVFENRPIFPGIPITIPWLPGFPGYDLPTIGWLAEYDALPGIGHACGHNLIALNAITAATLAAEAIVKYGVPARIEVIGTPDEENRAGKFTMNNAGAFEDSDVWMMAHPANLGGIQPMNCHLDYFARISAKTHAEVVFKAFTALSIVAGLAADLPGTASRAAVILNIGVYAVNTVQTFIGFGVAGLPIATVQAKVNSLLGPAYPGVAVAASQDKDGVALAMTGPGGQVANIAGGGPLALAINLFNALKDTAGVSFYLAGNSSVTVIDTTYDLRTRYTTDMPTVAAFVTKALGSLPDTLSSDVKYPALEPDPVIGGLFIDTVTGKDYGLTGIAFSDYAPAATDSSWIQNPVLDPKTKKLLSVSKTVIHSNYGICDPSPNPIVPCAINHEPAFKTVAGSEYGYSQTEIVARAQADMAVRILADPRVMTSVTGLIKNKKK